MPAPCPRAAVCRLATASAFALASVCPTSAFAAPAAAAPAAEVRDEAADPLLRLLAEKHLVETPTPLPATDAGMVRRLQDRASELVMVALNAVGVAYRRGGNSEASGFDCSGLTRYVFGHGIGLVLPRSADEQASAPGLIEVRREDLRAGDLVFFNTLRRTFSHVGIYIGDNRFVHAPSAGGAVRTEDMDFAYWKTRFTGARRADTVAQAQTGSPEAATVPAALR